MKYNCSFDFWIRAIPKQRVEFTHTAKFNNAILIEQTGQIH